MPNSKNIHFIKISFAFYVILYESRKYKQKIKKFKQSKVDLN